MKDLLLDSASLYYRAYYALPDSITNARGVPVNALRGFLDALAALIRERRPGRIVACWDDDWRPAWRVELVPSYKTHRVATEADLGEAEEVPDTLGPQIGLIAQALGLLGIPVVGRPGDEADDVIATIALRGDRPVDIASGDRDLVQLVDDRITLLYTGGSSASRGGQPWLEITPEIALSRFAVPASLYADLAILRGDPSDGLPGVPGIGEKTAAALVNAFGGLAGVLAAARQPDTLRPMTPRLAERIRDHADELARVERVVRLRAGKAIPAGSLRRRGVDESALAEFAAEWSVQASVERVRSALGSIDAF